MTRLVLALLLGLAGCNVVPPLDCLAGAGRPGCQRDANGEYGYLYRSAMTPNGEYDVPPIAAPAPITPPAPQPTTTTCYRTGNILNCTTR